jgi:hypothetical protein
VFRESSAVAPHVAGKHWPRALQERVRLEWLSGAGTLKEVAQMHGLPFGTLKRWHFDGRWARLKDDVRRETDEQTMIIAGNWLAEQREVHIRHVVASVEGMRAHVNAAFARRGLGCRDIARLAAISDTLDRMMWRALGEG